MEKGPRSSAFSCGSFDAFGFLLVVCPCSSLQWFCSARRAGRGRRAGPEEECLVLDLLCSHRLARIGRWRNGSLPRCVWVSCRGSTYPALWVGACLLYLFAVTHVVTPGSGIALAAGTCCASLPLVLDGKRAVVVMDAPVHQRDGIGAKRERAVYSLAAAALLL